MTYQLPNEAFNTNQAARNRVIKAQQFRDHIVQQYKSSYDAMWQTPRTHGDRALTMEQMQAVIDEMQPTMAEILQDSSAFVQFVVDTYPEALQDDNPLFPVRYTGSPYEYTVDQNRIQLTALKSEWEAQDEQA